MNRFESNHKEELKVLIMLGKKLHRKNGTKCMNHVKHWSNLYRNLIDYNYRGTLPTETQNPITILMDYE